VPFGEYKSVTYKRDLNPISIDRGSYTSIETQSEMNFITQEEDDNDLFKPWPKTLSLLVLPDFPGAIRSSERQAKSKFISEEYFSRTVAHCHI
jgi:hypothetical protein